MMSPDFNSLSPAQRQLAEALLNQAGIRTAISTANELCGSAQTFPLSFAQRRIWFLDELYQGNPAYNIPIGRIVTGLLDIQALEQSINAVINRHAILRTTVVLVDGVPHQSIVAHQPIRLVVIDIADLPVAVQNNLTECYVMQEAHQVFSLTQGPLLRALLLRLDATNHIFVLTTHHFVADGWSVRILLQEVLTYYRASVEQQQIPHPPLAWQFIDYIQWQQQTMTEAVLESQLGYWRDHLSGTLPFLNLPFDYPRKALQSIHGANYTFTLTNKLTQQLNLLSRQHHCTLFMTLATVFVTLLHHYTQQDDIVLATAVSNRNRREIEQLIGFFANTLLLRTDLSGNPPFLILLQQVREIILGAYAHQDVPFELLVEQLQPDRDLSRTPLFQVLFVLQNAPQEHIHLPNLTMRHLEIPSQTARFDLELAMTESEHALRGHLAYNTELFAMETIERMVRHFVNLLDAVVSSPNKTIAAFSYLDIQERQQLLIDWNNASAAPLEHSCIHQLFERQVEATPQAMAIDDGTHQMDYADLNRHANHLALHLRKLGVKPNTCVGLCVVPSVELVIGILGILKAGGAYVPLDPAYPRERLAEMLQQMNMSVVVSQMTLRHQLPATNAQMVYLDTHWEIDTVLSTSNLTNQTMPDHLLYVIYTSGSTGTPKGVGVTHRGFINLLQWFLADFHITAHDRVLLMSALSFDLTQKNIFAPLLVGGMLYLDMQEYYDPHRLVQTMVDQRITLLNCTPSAFYPLIDEVSHTQQANLTSLRYLFLGGEAIATSRLAQWILSDVCHTTVVNTYGPTECTDICAFYAIPTSAYATTAAIPIGRPIPHVQLYVLGPYLELVPAGIAGELYVGGAGVGMGYLAMPAMTATTFLPNPYSHRPGTRFYRTGDLVRWRTDGLLEFIGRIDQQIKLRGFRVELGEIETILASHPSVQEAIVVHQKKQQDGGRLVAFVTPTTQPSPPDHVPPPTLEQRERWIGAHRNLTLPNGLVIAHQNHIQTNIFYQEIFEANIYLRHGIKITDGACIFDVGANIGMFALFIQHHYQNTRIFAFEPSPVTFDILQANAGLYGIAGELFNCGLSSHSTNAVFRYYPHMSGMSGFFADTPIDRNAFTAMVLSQPRQSSTQPDYELSERTIQQLTTELFAEETTYTCQLRTLSDIIDQYQVMHIDLLKIDAEKSEVDILNGIAPHHWSRIQQLVIEVHHQTFLDQISTLLTQYGYQWHIDEGPPILGHPEDTASYQLFTIYACQSVTSHSTRAVDPQQPQPNAINHPAQTHLIDDLRRFVRSKLPEYMVPALFVMEQTLPLTPNGKVDRKALTARVIDHTIERTTPFVPPRNAVEQEVARLWCQLLEIDTIGIHDHFFDVGGHSLLLAQLGARLQTTFEVHLPLRILFDAPTIHEMTMVIAEQQLAQTDSHTLSQVLEEVAGLSPEEIARLLGE